VCFSTRWSLVLNTLFTGIVRFIHELAAKEIIITKFYATSVTKAGIAILRNTGFQEIGKLGERIAFELDTMKSTASLAKQYKAILHKAQNKDSRLDTKKTNEKAPV